MPTRHPVMVGNGFGNSLEAIVALAT